MIQGLFAFVALVLIYKWDKHKRKTRRLNRKKDFHNEDEQYFLFEEFIDPKD